MQIKKHLKFFNVINLFSKRKIKLWCYKIWDHLAKRLYIYENTYIYLERLHNLFLLKSYSCGNSSGWRKVKIAHKICAYFYMYIGTHNLYP